MRYVFAFGGARPKGRVMYVRKFGLTSLHCLPRALGAGLLCCALIGGAVHAQAPQEGTAAPAAPAASAPPAAPAAAAPAPAAGDVAQPQGETASPPGSTASRPGSGGRCSAAPASSPPSAPPRPSSACSARYGAS